MGLTAKPAHKPNGRKRGIEVTDKSEYPGVRERRRLFPWASTDKTSIPGVDASSWTAYKSAV